MGNMSRALAGYVSFAGLLVAAKYFLPTFRTALDGAFLAFMIGTTLLLFFGMLNEKCDVSKNPGSAGAVVKAVIFPWLLIAGSTMVLLNALPGWKQPFSNTFGYLAVHIPGIDAKGKLVAMLPANDLKKTIESNPSLLINEFNLENFDRQLEKLAVVDQSHAAAFRQVILLKELIAEFVWHILAGSLALITSFNLFMKIPCT